MGTGGGVLNGAAWLLSGMAMFVLWFFRDPDPDLPSDGDLVVAPGQGKIIVIQDVEELTFMSGPARKISIFLSVFDVHVQRAPVGGTVELQVYKPGRYMAFIYLDSTEPSTKFELVNAPGALGEPYCGKCNQPRKDVNVEHLRAAMG